MLTESVENRINTGLGDLMFILVIFLSGCLSESTVNTSALSMLDRIIASGAVSVEGLDTSSRGYPWDWEIVYGGANGKEGFAEFSQFAFCRIHLSRDLKPCDIGGRDRRLFVVLRHELKHCKRGDGKHSRNLGNLMHKSIPCWPTD